MSGAADTRILTEIFERLGEIQAEQKAQRREQESANAARREIRQAVEEVKREVSDLGGRVADVEEDTRRAVDFMDAAGEREVADRLKAAERRGAIRALRIAWEATTWTGRILGGIVIVAVAALGDSILGWLREAVLAFLNSGPG